MPTRRKAGVVVKTSLELPEPLWRRAKTYAAAHHTDLRAVIVAALAYFLPKDHEGGQT
jgi:hypothetical protein